ncbi:hypothetical protein Syun_001327 [Stephania yunnanensis]|uniref:Uncharacterized protein n=1 Tax=Stephania yunnanensis TaxID=152371 RepID=A0AAP0LFB2_9MAGN
MVVLERLLLFVLPFARGRTSLEVHKTIRRSNCPGQVLHPLPPRIELMTAIQ